jgi:hypothetical protein
MSDFMREWIEWNEAPYNPIPSSKDLLDGTFLKKLEKAYKSYLERQN